MTNSLYKHILALEIGRMQVLCHQTRMAKPDLFIFFLSAFISPHTAGYKIMLQNKTYIARWY